MYEWWAAEYVNYENSSMNSPHSFFSFFWKERQEHKLSSWYSLLFWHGSIGMFPFVSIDTGYFSEFRFAQFSDQDEDTSKRERERARKLLIEYRNVAIESKEKTDYYVEKRFTPWITLNSRTVRWIVDHYSLVLIRQKDAAQFIWISMEYIANIDYNCKLFTAFEFEYWKRKIYE